MKLYLAIVFLSILAALSLFSFPYLNNNFLETSAPKLIIKNIPKGFGEISDKIEFEVKDMESGIDQVLVRIFQNTKRIKIFSKKYNRTNSTLISVNVSGQELELEKGIASIQIRAFDSSFWNNKAELNFNLGVDYNKPEISLLSTQHNVRINGSQLIVYRVKDNNLSFHGIKHGKNFYKGFNASFLDRQINLEGVYASLFSYNEENLNSKLKIIAEDKVGNVSSKKFKYKILKNYTKNLNKRYFGKQKLKEFVFIKLKKEIEDLLINKESEIYPLLIKNEFSRFPGTLNTIYGNKLKFYKDGNLDVTFNSDYLEVNLSNFGNEVFALNSGRVSEIGSNPVLGKYVILDHGANIKTFYANLDETYVDKNQKVEKLETIGTTGKNSELTSTIIKPYSLFFKLYIGSTAVEPKEWWDENWFKGHILNRIKDTKVELGLGTIYKGL